ncbi:hypothetical protein J7643_07740 [bacterium]|nr:hypothetical protein [bacterium]
MDEAERKLNWYGLLLLIPALAFLGALAMDLTYAVTQNGAWFGIAGWLIALGLVGGVLAALPGLDYFVHTVPRTTSAASKLATAHMALSVAVLVLFGLNLALRQYGASTAWARWLAVYLTVFGNLEMGVSLVLALRLRAYHRSARKSRLHVTMSPYDRVRPRK